MIRNNKDEALETLLNLCTERVQRAERKWEKNAQNLIVLGELLEKCYIHSTDIEYSQFYMKELAIFAENYSQVYKEESQTQVQDLRAQAKSIFEKMEMKKSQYFKENAKEMSGSEQILRSLNLNLKQEKDNLESLNYELKQKMREMRDEMGQLKDHQQRNQKDEAVVLELKAELANERKQKMKELQKQADLEVRWRKRTLGLESECELLRRKLEEVKQERETTIFEMEKEMESMAEETEQIWRELREEQVKSQRGREEQKMKKAQTNENRSEARLIKRLEEEVETKGIELRNQKIKMKELSAQVKELKRQVRAKDEELKDVENNLEEVEKRCLDIDSKMRQNERTHLREKRRDRDFEQRLKENEDHKNELLLEIERKRKENLDFLQQKNTEILNLKTRITELEIITSKLKSELELKSTGITDMQKVVDSKGAHTKNLENKLILATKNKAMLHEQIEQLTQLNEEKTTQNNQLKEEKNKLEKANTELKTQNENLTNANIQLENKNKKTQSLNDELEKSLGNTKEQLNAKLNDTLKKLEKSILREKEIAQKLLNEQERLTKFEKEKNSTKKLSNELTALRT